MLSIKEKRFKSYWNEQRSGGKRRYLLLYTFAYTFMMFTAPVVFSFFIDKLDFLGLNKLSFWGLLILAVIISFALSKYFWERNEKKMNLILKKESGNDYSIY